MHDVVGAAVRREIEPFPDAIYDTAFGMRSAGSSIDLQGVPVNERATNSHDLALSFLGAAAAGIGSLGVVSGVGGVIMFERFSQAGLPAEEAVAVQPKALLLAVGAETLIPLAALVLAIVSVYLAAVRRFQRLEFNIEWFALSAGLACVVYYLAAVGFSLKPDLVAVVGITILAMVLWAVLAERPCPRALQCVLLAIAIALIGASIGLLRTIDAPKVRGAAVLFTGTQHSVASGLFVAENSDRIYLGQVQFKAPGSDRPRLGTGALVVLDRKLLSTVALGSNEGPATARVQADQLAQALRSGTSKLSVSDALSGTAGSAPPVFPTGGGATRPAP